MRNRPRIDTTPKQPAKDYASPSFPVRRQTPEAMADAVVPFLQAGGQPFIFQDFDGGFSADTAGVQLLAEQYIPTGFTGWIKRFACAPYCPPSLFDPWAGWPGNFEYFEPVPLRGLGPVRGSARAGLWKTPAGWESYVSIGTEIVPSWRWAITLFTGSAADWRARQAIPPFDPAVPASWVLAPNVAVPAVTYPNGLPGTAMPGVISDQRMQVLPDDAFATHWQVPGDHTIMLWAYWSQSLARLMTYAPSGPSFPFEALEIYPLLSSYGMIHGYMGISQSEAARENARFGWGG